MHRDAEHRMHETMSRRGRVLQLIAYGWAMGVLLWAVPAQGQTLIERYQAARYDWLVQRTLQEGERGLPRLPLDWVATAGDSLRAPARPAAPRTASDTAGTFTLTDVRVVRRLERTWFEERFRHTEWSFLGAGRYFTLFDTTQTRELRARLQAHFGDPTQALGDFDLREPREVYIQFEYWFVVNDSIPVVITDANGAYDRGLIVASDARYREKLFALRRALLAPVRKSDRRAPYVDYFFDEEVRRWYRTGFDGEEFFMEYVPRYQLVPGRRPWLEDTRADTAASNASSRPPR